MLKPKESMEAIQKILIRLRTIENLILSQNGTLSKWMTEAEAMQEIGCKKTKLRQLRDGQELIWRYASGGRGVRILRKSVDKYNDKCSI